MVAISANWTAWKVKNTFLPGLNLTKYEYDEYGNIRSTTLADGTEISGYASQIGNEYLFQGRRYEPETGLYYYRARYYDPVKGRFITRDPKGYV